MKAWSDRLGPLAERPFRLLWLGRSLSSIGDALIPVAAAFAVLDIGSATDLGLVLGAEMGGRMVFVLIGGVFADRLPRRAVMIGADAVRAGIQAVIAAAFFTGGIEVWHLVVSFFLFGTASAFFDPASTGLVPQVVSASRLQEANALLGLSRNAIKLFGPAAAGVLVATAGYTFVFAIDAASFVASLLCLPRMPRLPRLPARAQSVLADAREGIGEVLKRRWMVVTLTADVFANFAIAPYFVLGPLVVREHLGGAPDWGLIVAAGAAGGLAGGILVLRWKPARPLVVAYAALVALPLALLALVPPLPLPLLMLGGALFTMSIVVGNTLWQTMEQQHVPNHALARVDSVSWMIAVTIMPLAYVVTGPVVESIGVRETLVAAAAIGLASTVGVLLSRSVRELRPVEAARPSRPPAASAADGSRGPALPVPPP